MVDQTPGTRRRGRPTKFSPKIARQIIKALRSKETRKAAYKAAGISHDTFAVWIRTKPEFARAVREATTTEETRRLRAQVEELIRRNAARAIFGLENQEQDPQKTHLAASRNPGS
jgi:HEAT repeat protein